MSEEKAKAEKLVKIVLNGVEKDLNTNIDLSEILPLVEEAVSELEKRNWERTIQLALKAKDRLRITRMTVCDQWDQEKMEKATVFVAGVGSLGCEVAKNLILMGIGRVILCDYDDIELSNVSRQMLFRDDDVGKKKVYVARKHLLRMNESSFIEAYSQRIQELPENIYEECDVLISCLDSFVPRRYLNSASVSLEKPLVDGGIKGLQGVVYAFHPPPNRMQRVQSHDGPGRTESLLYSLGKGEKKSFRTDDRGKKLRRGIGFFRIHPKRTSQEDSNIHEHCSYYSWHTNPRGNKNYPGNWRTTLWESALLSR
jgi:molybdopterin/thiamine biosynthesis adenylyltransferase